MGNVISCDGLPDIARRRYPDWIDAARAANLGSTLMAKSGQKKQTSTPVRKKPSAKKADGEKRSATRAKSAAPRVRSLLQPEIPNPRKSARLKSATPSETVARSRSAAPPQPAADAELIVRQGFIIDATGGSQAAIPEVLILGNEAGLRYLADVCAHLAGRADDQDPSVEPADAFHLARLSHPINARLSDAMEFSLAPLTAANRAATFKRHGITMKSREHGSLFGRYQEAAQADSRKAGKQPSIPDPQPEQQ
jgi:hypothetical protein